MVNSKPCKRCRTGHKPLTLEHVRCNQCIGYAHRRIKSKYTKSHKPLTEVL